MILRTMLNRPKKSPISTLPMAEGIDGQKIAKHLSEAIQIPTITMVDEFSNNQQAFYDYHAFLERTYPLIHKNAEKTLIEGFSLIYHIKGSNQELKPACFLSHQDVVPASDEGWEHGCFSGKITEDGYIYGRGALDMKNHMLAIMEAIELMISQGTVFERDIYLCFGHDEEPNTSMVGAPNIVKHLQSQGVKLEFVFDEGGTMLEGKMFGVKGNIALVGCSEKGNTDIEVSVHKAGGHGSSPKHPTSIDMLAKAITKIEKNPMKPVWTNVTKKMFKELSPYCNPVFKYVMTNRDILSPILKKAFTKVDPMANALVATTFAPTMLWGSNGRNVLPYDSKVNFNTRIITGSSIKETVDYLQNLLGKEYKVELAFGTEPTPESDIDCKPFEMLTKSIGETFENVVPAPYTCIASTDARFYTPLTNNIYRFNPVFMTSEDQNRIHGLNERISIEAMEKATSFFVRYISNTCLNQ